MVNGIYRLPFMEQHIHELTGSLKEIFYLHTPYQSEITESKEAYITIYTFLP